MDTYKGEINKEQFIRDKKTILIFDTESIKDAIKNSVNKYKDGTYNNFDKVVDVPGTGMCHIINSNKNMETSEIIRAYKKLNSKSPQQNKQSYLPSYQQHQYLYYVVN